MRGFLLTLMVLGSVCGVAGCLMLLAVLPDATKPAVVFVPQLIAAEVMAGIGFLLAATAGGLAEVTKLLSEARGVTAPQRNPAPATSGPGADYVNPRYAPTTATGADGVTRARRVSDWPDEDVVCPGCGRSVTPLGGNCPLCRHDLSRARQGR